MNSISVCIITKNEAHYLKQCLECIKDYNFEIIIVDTGSIDNSIEVAKKYTSLVYEFEWINDFSAAKNFAISKATNDWILSLDTDEFVYELDKEGVSDFITCHPRGIGSILLTSKDTQGAVTTKRLGRFFKRSIYHFERPIHEQLIPLDGMPSEEYPIPIAVNHVGYAGEKDAFEKKVKRNLDLLLSHEADYPDAYTYYQIGQCYYVISEWEKAKAYFEKGLSGNINPALDYIKLMVVNYGYCLSHLNQSQTAIELLEPLSSSFDSYADFVFLLGYLYMENGNYLNATLHFIKATYTTDYTVEGSNSYRAFYNLGLLYEMMGNKDMAILFYQKCDSFEPALIQLKKACCNIDE